MVVLAKNKKEFLECFLETTNVFNDNDTEYDLLFYPVVEILFLTIVAMLSGIESWYATVNFGIEHLLILREYLPFKCGIPKAFLVSRLFNLIDNKCCDRWMRDYINILLKNLNLSKNNLTITEYLEHVGCKIVPKVLFLKLSNNLQQCDSIVNYISIENGVYVNNRQDLNQMHNYDGNIIEIQLITENHENNSQAANNMLILRQIVIDIIKKHKIKKCSKLGINVIRRLASNNKMMLVDILNNWIYDN